MSRRTRTIAIASLVLAAWLPAVPSNAQNFTGRIDVVVTDATGGVLPGVNVQIAGPMNQTAVTDTRGEAHFLNLNCRQLHRERSSLQGFQAVEERGRCRVVAGGAVRWNVKLGIAGSARDCDGDGGNPRHRPEEADDRHQRHPRRTAEHPVGARPLGRHADRARHHRRPRERRRVGVRPAVGLPGEGRGKRRERRGTWTACRSPTWRRPARRPPTTTSTCSRRCRSRRAARTSRPRPAAWRSTSS